jgi:hypothetical protein
LCEILQTGGINEFMEKTERLTTDLVRSSIRLSAPAAIS